jgi:O-antigen/teichoic acid export membrane protein
MFPEISKISAEDRKTALDSHVEDALAYAGLFIIPGFVGVVVLGRGILNIYGTEFQQGYQILLLLVAGTLVHGYHKQLMNTLDAINRPDLTFRVNILFTMSNISLNFVLIYLYGWIGAAVATFVSVSAAMIIAFRMLSALMTFSIPHKQILSQVLSAVVMGSTVAGLARGLNSVGINTVRLVPVLVLVSIGVLVYLGTLTVVSTDFRRIVSNNTPDL